MQPVQIKTEEPVYQQLLTKIADLEPQQRQFLQKFQSQNQGASSSNDNAMQQPRQSRMSSGCFYCGGGHGIGDCELAKSDVTKGRCRQDGRRIVYLDGSEIRMDGKRLVERVAEFNKAHPEYEKMHQKQSGNSVAAMLVEVGQPLLANALLQAPVTAHEPENTDCAEQRWWAFMMDTMHAMVAKQAEKSTGSRTGLRSQAGQRQRSHTGLQRRRRRTRARKPRRRTGKKSRQIYPSETRRVLRRFRTECAPSKPPELSKAHRVSQCRSQLHSPRGRNFAYRPR